MTPRYCISLIISIIVLFVSFSCENDEEKVDPKKFISYTATAPTNSWIIISDDAGKVLLAESMTGMDSVYLDGFKDEYLSVTILTGNNTPTPTGVDLKVYFINTYTNVAPGRYSSIFFTNAPKDIKGTHTLKIPDHFYIGLWPTVEQYCGFAATDRVEYKFSLCVNTSKLYAWIQDKAEDAPRYLYRPQISVNETTILDYATYSQLPLLSSKVVALEKDAISGTSYVYGNTLMNSNMPVSLSLIQNSSNIPLYYPKELEGSLFSSYDVELIYRKEDAIMHRIKKRSAEIGTTYPELTTNLDQVIENKFPTLSFKSSGSAHYVQATIQHASPALQIFWHAYGPFASDVSFKLPELSSELKQRIGIEMPTDLKWTTITYVEDSDRGSYEKFYLTALKNEAAMTSTTTKNSREKVITLPN